ncbi:hypothetical protein G6M50_23980 [Agrobacterium rhizogenes]|nr:hypothetical protein [Rhizobium rhizogenes]NTJ80862.1 hypothetical protein [Rhizobium rhizogenes]
MFNLAAKQHYATNGKWIPSWSDWASAGMRRAEPLPVRLSNYHRKNRPPAERFNLTLKPIEGLIDPRLVRLRDAVNAAQATRSEYPEKPQIYKSHRLQPKRSLRPITSWTRWLSIYKKLEN